MPGDPHPALCDYQDETRVAREKRVREIVHTIITTARQIKNERESLAWLRGRDQIAAEFAAKLCDVLPSGAHK